MRRLLAALLLLSATPSAADGLSLPFAGRWFVMQGGDTLNVNHHMSVRAQAYGIDFAKVGGVGGGQLARGDASRVSDFYSWGEKVLAPADGTVVAVVSDLPDNPLGVKDPKNAAGNHVVLEIEDGQFVFLAHLQQGTVSVRPGDGVRRAQPLGLCGNSGNSDFPHVHLHIQDTPTFDEGSGQNPIFGPIDVELTGKRFEAVTWPLIRGLFVSNSKSRATRSSMGGRALSDERLQRRPEPPAPMGPWYGTGVGLRTSTLAVGAAGHDERPLAARRGGARPVGM